MAESGSFGQRWPAVMRLAALAGALALGACQTVVPRSPPPVDQVPTVPIRPPQRPIDDGIPQDTQRHRVALLVPTTGSNAAVGQSLANATLLALLDSKSERVRITTYDTAAGATAAAQRAIADGNRLILGPLLAEDVRAVLPIARSARVPVISFSNDASIAGGGAYLMGNSPAQAIARVVAYAHDRGVTDFAGLMPITAYGQRAQTLFLRAVEGGGGRVLTLQSYGREAGAMAAATAKMKGSPYQAVMVADTGANAAMIVPLARRNGGAAAHVLGTEQWNLDTALASRPALAGAWYASVADGLYRQYAAKYRARFGAAPYRLSSLGYDAVLLTLRIARDWQIGAPFPEDQLEDRGGFVGIDGAFRFGRDGVAERALEVREVRGGTLAVVSPAPTGFGR